MPEAGNPSEEQITNPPESREPEPVCESWRTFIQSLLVLFMVVATAIALRYSDALSGSDLKAELQQLRLQVQQLKQEQAMPAMVLARYRNSICYIYGVYQVGYPEQAPALRARLSGTGFLVAGGLLATNRHVAQPWYGDNEADALIANGAVPQLEKLEAFFPGMATPVDVTPAVVASQGDLAVLRINKLPQRIAELTPLSLATKVPRPGEIVAVVGYPLGVTGMVAKSPNSVYQRLAYRRDDINTANELAALSLIRPSATYGHLGDVVGDKLIYDAPTAHGGSGGPVFNARGEVIGINSAFLDGFSGGTLGISVDALRPLITAAEKQ
ncbi:MAG TPA: serine protease [Terriglobales bacterium]|nr:serine protease [Terriglobales bacterium]